VIRMDFVCFVVILFLAQEPTAEAVLSTKRTEEQGVTEMQGRSRTAFFVIVVSFVVNPRPLCTAPVPAEQAGGAKLHPYEKLLPA